jgi:hypothetical protein
MEVITSIKIKVPDSKIDELKSGFESLKDHTWPKGMVVYLSQDANENGSYILLIIMEDEEILEKIKSTPETPILDLFKKLGIETTSTEVYNVTNTFTCPSSTHVPYYDIK